MINDEKCRQMLEMRLNGATYKEIGEKFGMTKQGVNDNLSRYIRRLSGTVRGKCFSINDIVYEGIYDYFDKNSNMTISRFSQLIFESNAPACTVKIRKFITGEHNALFKLHQIQKMCEVIGKPFEEVFKERKAKNCEP